MRETLKRLPYINILKAIYHSIISFFRLFRYYPYEIKHSLSVTYNKEIGITTLKRQTKLIVSLTTIPERLGKLALCLDSLLTQSLKPDMVILWLQTDKLNPSHDNLLNELPARILKLRDRGLEIKTCEKIGSYAKIIPCLELYPTSIIVTADDDVLYPHNWLKLLYTAFINEPQYIHCHRAHRMKFNSDGSLLPYIEWDLMADKHLGPDFNLFPTGVGGVLYGPGHLHPDVLNKDLFLSLAPRADDVWLKAMSLLAGTQCKKINEKSFVPLELRIRNNRTLSSENVLNQKNDSQIRAVANFYGIFNVNMTSHRQ